MFRFAFNTAFIPKDGLLTFFLGDLDPDSVKENKYFPSNFIVEVRFKNSCCDCTNETIFEEKCSACMMDLEREKTEWEIIYNILRVFFSYFFILFYLKHIGLS